MIALTWSRKPTPRISHLKVRCPPGAIDGLRAFIRQHALSSNPNSLRKIQPKSSQQTAIHLIPFIMRPEVFPQSFFRLANVGSVDETVELILSDDEGNVEWGVEIDLFGGETRHVNSDDIAGLTTKGGIRVSYFGSNIRARKNYFALSETSTKVYMRAFTRSIDGFINDVGTLKVPFRANNDRWTTILGTANPGSNRAVVGWIRYVNLETEFSSIDVDLWGYDDTGRRSSTVTCRIPQSGALMIEIDSLERAGNHPWCSGTWGAGKGEVGSLFSIR